MRDIPNYVLHYVSKLQEQQDDIIFSGPSKENQSQRFPRANKRINIKPFKNLKQNR